MMSKVRVFFASDIHGSERCFMKFLNAGRVYKADVLILSGDITGKMIVPIVEEGSGTFTIDYLGRKAVKSLEELSMLEKRIRDSGYYPYRADEKEMEELSSDKGKVDELFLHVMVESVRRWIEIAEERLQGTGVRCFISPGNDDHFVVDSVLNDSEYITNPDGKVVNIDDDHEMVTCGYSNITPWNSPRECSEEELADKIQRIISQVKDIKNCLFNFHCPPHNTHIDLAPRLDETLKPVRRGGQIEMVPVGSVAVRSAIEKHQPLLGLHGHIHESKGAERIGRTLCLNPGSEYTEGILRGVIIDLDKDKVKSYLFTSG